MKNVIRFFWTKQDNLVSIQSKLINLIGCELIQRQNESVPVTIFSVSEIKEDKKLQFNLTMLLSLNIFIALFHRLFQL